jgi:hypothetical protein
MEEKKMIISLDPETVRRVMKIKMKMKKTTIPSQQSTLIQTDFP